MPLQNLNSFSKVLSDLADKPNMTAAELKIYFDSSPEELRVFVNGVISVLRSTVNGDSGADNVGATPITPNSGETVQAILEYLKLQIDNVVINTIPDASVTRAKLALDTQKTLDQEVIFWMGV